VHFDKADREHWPAVEEFFTNLYAQNRKLIGNLFFQKDGKTKTAGQVQEHITYSLLGNTFMFLPETFIQANILTNESLVKRTMELLFDGIEPKKEVVLDLYAGIGNFSLPIAQQVKKVVAVEGQEAAVLAGEANVLRNKIENVTYMHASTGKFLKKYLVGDRDATMAVLDPPRVGCSDAVIERLLQAKIPRLVYVSCNPVSLANDLQRLQKIYEVKRVVGVDMFPDVSHVETIVLLDKK